MKLVLPLSNRIVPVTILSIQGRVQGQNFEETAVTQRCQDRKVQIEPSWFK